MEVSPWVKSININNLQQCDSLLAQGFCRNYTNFISDFDAMVRIQSVLLVAILLCYVMIAPIIARPLANDVKKRQSSSEQMEDVQLSAAGEFPVGNIATYHRRS